MLMLRKVLGQDLTLLSSPYKQKWSATFPLPLSFLPKLMLKSWRSVQSTQKIKQLSHLIVRTLEDCHQIQCASCIPLAPGTCIVHEHYLRSFDNIHDHFLRNQYICPLSFSSASQKLKKEKKKITGQYAYIPLSRIALYVHRIYGLWRFSVLASLMERYMVYLLQKHFYTMATWCACG